MSTIAYILLFTFLGSVFSLIGGLVLLFKQQLALKISHLLASFAAGTLLGVAFFDLIPEAAHEAEESGFDIFPWILVGLLVFFLLERFLHWFHHHHEHKHEKGDDKPTIPLIMIGDSMHNFIDGVVIAATFMVNIPLGIVTTLAVAAHEIPQEIGDFGIMLHRGVRRKKILFYNMLSAAAAFAGAILTFFLGERIEMLIPLFLALTAGFFIYIAASDLIPEIHEENRKGFAVIETVLLLLGVVLIWTLISIVEQLGVH